MDQLDIRVWKQGGSGDHRGTQQAKVAISDGFSRRTTPWGASGLYDSGVRPAFQISTCWISSPSTETVTKFLYLFGDILLMGEREGSLAIEAL